MAPVLEMDSADLNPNITFLLKFVFREIRNYSESQVGASNVSLTYTSNGTIITAICFYLKMVIISVGILGNGISFVAFLKSRLGTGTVGHYLISLALADNIVLISEIPIWMSQHPLGYAAIDEYNWLCRLTYYAKYTGRIWSACLTLIVTVERYLFVAHPLKKVYIQKHHTHRILIPITLTISLLCVCYSLFLIEIQPQSDGNMCFIADDRRTVFLVLDFVIVRGIGDLVIGGCIMLFTILCINVLHKAKKIRNNNIQEQSSLCSSCGNQIHRVHKKNYKSRESQITKMLLMLAIMFLIFKVPYTIFYYCTLNWYRKTRQNLSLFEVVINGAKSLSETFALTSYAFNFFVYVMLMPSFRHNFYAIFKCKCPPREAPMFKILSKHNTQAVKH